MSIILDIVLIAILAFYIITAAKKGFIRTVLELVAVAVAFFLSFQISPVIAQGTYDAFVEKGIVSTLEEEISADIDSMSVAEKTTAVLDSIPEFAVSLASSAGVEISTIKEQIASQKLDSENVAQSLADSIVEPIVVGALTIITFILLAIVLTLLLKFVVKYFAKLFNIPIVKSINKGLGGALGGIKGTLILILICTALRLLFGDGESELSKAVNDSFMVGLLDKINPFIDSLKAMLTK